MITVDDGDNNNDAEKSTAKQRNNKTMKREKKGRME
jgi:hypothetical protein